MTSLATAIGGMKHWDWCPICKGGLDTGLECDQCGADLMPIYKAFKDLLARPSDSVVLRAIKARADRSRLGYGGKAWVTSDPKSEVVEDRMLLVEIVCRQEFAINRLRAALNEAADSFKNVGLSVDAENCEEAINESLSGGNPGEPKACTPAEERGIAGATGAGQPPDGNPESTGDSADRRSPDGTERTPSPDESNRHFERGCYVLAEMMQAYERRVRSDCKTQSEIDKRPWECAEYVAAASYLRAVWPPPAPPRADEKPPEQSAVIHEALHDVIQEIYLWEEAYPLDVFPEPDLKRCRELLGSSELSRLSAHCMRHVITRVCAKLRAAIEPPRGGEMDKAAIMRICHAVSDNCVMVTDPDRPPCTAENCAAMRAAYPAGGSLPNTPADSEDDEARGVRG